MARLATAPAHRGLGRLREAGEKLVCEYHADGWPHLKGEPSSAVRVFLLGELLDRCPGFSTREYRAALDVRLVQRQR